MSLRRYKAAEQQPAVEQTAEAPAIDPKTATLWTPGVADGWVAMSEQMVALRDRDNALQAETQAIDREIGRTLAIDFTQADHMRATETRHRPEPVATPKKLSPTVKRLLGIHAPADPPPPPPAPPVNPDEPATKFRHPRMERLAEISRERTAIAEAQDVLREQLVVAKREGSKRLCEILRPEYQAVVRRMADAAAELAMARMAHDEFMQRQCNAETAWLKPPAIELLPTRGAVREFVVTAASLGHINLADMPVEIANKP